VKKSCSIFFYEGYLDISPTLISLSKILNERGYLVTFYLTNSGTSNPVKVDESINIIYFQHSNNIPIFSSLRYLLAQVKLGSFIPVLDLAVFGFQFFIYLLFAWLFDKNKFRLIKNDSFNLGVDKNGSILSLLKSQLLNQEHIYLSLELIDPKSLGRLFLVTGIVNQLERIAYRKAKCVFVQDEVRFKTLSDYNQYLHPQVLYLPNSLYRTESLFDPNFENKNYFRDLFQLREEEYPYIILQAGMIAPEVCSEEIAQAFAAIDEGYALVFNTATVMDLDDPYIQSLKVINQKNLFLSLNPVPYERLSKIYRSATIGLALYRDIDPNFSQIAKASGKLSNYLQYGKPVIVSALPSLVNLVEQYQFGIAVKDPSDPTEVIAAIKKILENYSYYCRNARYCFEMEYDFNEKIKPFFSFINS
jgi:glycosyltransferase involved in cell wall biosynthesis